MDPVHLGNMDKMNNLCSTMSMNDFMSGRVLYAIDYAAYDREADKGVIRGWLIDNRKTSDDIVANIHGSH